MKDSEALELVMQMMEIPGQSGDELAVMEFIAKHIEAVGIPRSQIASDSAHRRTPVPGNHGNMVCKLPGTLRGPRRMFSAHTDTVPICVGARPVRKKGRISSADKATGLGADDRAGAAVLLATLMTIVRDDRPHPPLTFLWTVQEEVGLQGARNLKTSMLGKPSLAFNFDGGSPSKLTIGATGGYRIEIIIEGIASHAGGAPEEGVSAITIASLAIADLTDNGWHGLITKGKKSGTSNVGVIEGGAATNVVCDRVTIHAEARSHDAKFRERIVSEIRKAFERARKKVKNAAGTRGKVEFNGRLDYESFRLAHNVSSVETAAAAVECEGLKPELAIANGGLDANWLNAHGIQTVSLGCGQRNIHTVAEELDIAEFHAARRIALRLATSSDSD